MNTYQYGQYCARVKLGMEAGPAPYAPTETRTPDFADNTKQLFWRSVDEEPSVTGDESGIGMPSPSKTGSENDGGYGDPSGPYAAGSFDADQERPDRDQRKDDNIARGFETNQLLDQSYAPEAASTQPHGPKMAFATGLNAKAGISGAARIGGNMSRIAPLPKLPNPMGFKGNSQNVRAGTQLNSPNTRAHLANTATSDALSKSMTPTSNAGITGNLSASVSPQP